MTIYALALFACKHSLALVTGLGKSPHTLRIAVFDSGDSSRLVGSASIKVSMGLTAQVPRAHVCFGGRAVAFSRFKGTT